MTHLLEFPDGPLVHILALASRLGSRAFCRVHRTVRRVVMSDAFRQHVREMELQRMRLFRDALRTTSLAVKAELDRWRTSVRGLDLDDLRTDPTNANNPPNTDWGGFELRRGGFYGQWEEQRFDVLRLRPTAAQLRDASGNMSAMYWCAFAGPLLQLIFLAEEGANLDAIDNRYEPASFEALQSHVLYAAASGQNAAPEKIQFALDRGVAIDAADERFGVRGCRLLSVLLAHESSQVHVLQTLDVYLLAGCRPESSWLCWSSWLLARGRGRLGRPERARTAPRALLRLAIVVKEPSVPSLPRHRPFCH